MWNTLRTNSFVSTTMSSNFVYHEMGSEDKVNIELNAMEAKEIRNII